jgi:hypothetical protein
MRKTTLVLFMVLVLTLSLGAFAFQNEPEGFRGLKWGDPPTENMTKLSRLDLSPLSDSGTYRIFEGENLQIGGAELERIEYRFYKGQLLGVFIETKFNEGEPLQDVVDLKFGMYDIVKDLSGKYDYCWCYEWTGDITTIKLVLSGRYFSREAELTIYSTEIDHQYQEDLILRSQEEARRKEQARQKAAEEGLADL